MLEENTTVHKGKTAEDLACRFLQAKNLQLVEKNFRSYFGEIDLIMLDNNTLVFVEVRYRNKSNFGLSRETIHLKKQTRIIKTAQYYLTKKKIFEQKPCRFDVIAIEGTQAPNWIPNAFTL